MLNSCREKNVTKMKDFSDSCERKGTFSMQSEAWGLQWNLHITTTNELLCNIFCTKIQNETNDYFSSFGNSLFIKSKINHTVL